MGIYHAAPCHAPGQGPRQGATRANHRSASPRAMGGRLVQAALVVGAAHDRFEIEADRVAEQVIARLARRSDDETADRRESDDAPPGGHTAAVGLQPTGLAATTPGAIGRAPALSATTSLGPEGGEATPEVASAIEASTGGRALDDGLRARMEPAFGADLGAVRIHTGAAATALNQSLGARAFTSGTDIFFSDGEYRPRTAAGQHLLAHELTHTIQQSGGVSRIRRSTVPRARADEAPATGPPVPVRVSDDRMRRVRPPP